MRNLAQLARRRLPAWDEAERRRAAELGLHDIEPGTQAIIDRTRPFTLTSPERIASLCAAIDYVVGNGIPGAVVECGVWRGGSLMAAALRLLDLGQRDRELVGFDTFSGMSQPSTLDVDFRGKTWHRWVPPGTADPGASLGEVRQALRSTGYPLGRVKLVPGDVSETLPHRAPRQIALLRLDTDWYESTRVELERLYPRVVLGGILIVDDYGHYRGARQAVDEYFAQHRIFLHRIDYTGRIAVKQHA